MWKKRGIAVLSLIVLIVLALFICIHDQSKPVDLNSVTDLTEVKWFGDDEDNIALTDNYWFYIDKNLIKYYDPRLGKSYVVCSKPNCLHTNNRCDAYIQSSTLGLQLSSTAVAASGKYLYILNDNGSTRINGRNVQCEQIIRMNPVDGSRKILAEFPVFIDAQPGDEYRFIKSFPKESAQLFNNYLWVNYVNSYIPGENDLNGDDSNEWTQAIGVNLNTGEVIDIGHPDFDCNVVAYTDKYVAYYHRKKDREYKLSLLDYMKQYGDGGFVLDGVTFDSYTDYMLWEEGQISSTCDYYLYDLHNGSTSKIWSTRDVIVPLVWAPNNMGYTVPKTIVGAYQGRFLVEELIPDDNGSYNLRHFVLKLFDPLEGIYEDIIEVEYGGLQIISNRIEGSNYVLPDGWLYFTKYDENETEANIWGYNLNTKEIKFCFTDSPVISFRIYGLWNNGYFGKIAGEDEIGRHYAWISREDYQKGYLKNIIKYDIK